MIQNIFLTYLFSIFLLYKIIKDSEYFNEVELSFGLAFNAHYDNICLGIFLLIVFGLAMQRNLFQKNNLFIIIIHFATEMLHTISNN